ncbi:MAG: glycosyltransferase family 2 protein [Tidjanibacter sp.]|nr:glycosyltransferase family 2 protein [Tidjanibacter sp.]
MTAKVVILNWNGEKFLSKFLYSVVESLPQGVGVVVADNGSTDNSKFTVEMFNAAPDIELEVEWLPLGENFGFAEGYNRALARIEADVYVLLNSDVEPQKGWLDPLLIYLEEHDDVAAVQPKILSYDHPDHFEYAGAAGGFVDRFGYPFCRGRIMQTTEKDEGQYDDVREVFWASGACMAIKAEAYRRAGGLDGDFFAHMEEIDLCWRLQLMGWKVAVVPQGVVRHVGGGTLPNNSPMKIYLNFRNSLCMLHKCLPKSGLWRLKVRRWMDILSCVVYRLSGQKEFAKQVLRAHDDYKTLRPALDAKREAVLREAVVLEPPTIWRGWIVWRYMLGRQKSFKGIVIGNKK